MYEKFTAGRQPEKGETTISHYQDQIKDEQEELKHIRGVMRAAKQMIEEEVARPEGGDANTIMLCKERVKDLEAKEGLVLSKIIQLNRNDREVGEAFEDWQPEDGREH